jgi:uncharacterized protein (DUF488 family)
MLPPNNQGTIWTVGHSTRSLAEFLDILASAAITCLADVRRFPASRRYPHFNQQPLAEALAARKIRYETIPNLGGRRRPLPDSANTAWRNLSFRGYADYMQTDTFRQGIEQILLAALTERVALMCSEAVWWRCHRALIADYLTATGYPVIHLLSASKAAAHRYTAPAQVRNGSVTYTLPVGSE